MRKAFRDKKLFFVFFGKFNAVPFSRGFRFFSQIHGYIKHAAFDDSHEFRLWKLFLKMKSAKNSFGRARLIVLHECNIYASLFHIVLIVCFHKVAAAVAINRWCNYAKTFYSADIFFNFYLSHC